MSLITQYRRFKRTMRRYGAFAKSVIVPAPRIITLTAVDRGPQTLTATDRGPITLTARGD